MDTIIYSAIGMVIIVSGAILITFISEVKHKCKDVAVKIKGFGTTLNRNALNHHKMG